MRVQAVDRSAAPTALRFDRVTKVFSDSLVAARKYALKDIIVPRRDRPAQLREHEHVVLRDISFEIKDGQTLLVVGMQEAGKSVLADLITGKRRPDSGTIDRRGSVGVIGAGKYGQHPLMTVQEYVRLMLALHGVRAAILNQVRDEVIEWAGLTAQRDKIVFDLPKSIVTPLTMIGSLLTEHDIYVFDNYKPFGDTELDMKLAARFEQIQSKRTCVVMGRGSNVPTHVDHMLILHAGEVIFSGDPDTGLTIYDQFGERVRARRKQRGPRQPAMPTVDEAVAMVTSLLGSGGPLVGIDRALTQLAGLNRPFIVGPYLSDSSWEVLFWLPFVRWVRRQLGPSPSAIALTHGDVSAWYSGVTDSFFDIYNLISPTDYDTRNAERIHETSALKQIAISTFEHDLMQMVASLCGFTDPKALHPSLVLALSAKVARGGLDMKEIADRAVFAPLTPGGHDLDLPKDYIVVAFRFVKHFPDSHANRLLVADVVREASRLAPVVVLGEHEWLWSDNHLPADGRVHAIRSAAADVRHGRRQEVAVIGGARAVVGTVNGLVTFAPFCGVPGLCLHAPQTGKVDVTTSMMNVAAERLGNVPLLTAALGSMKPADIGRWLEQAIEGRLVSTAQGGTT